MTEMEGMISVSAEAQNGAGELVIEMSEADLHVLGAKPADKIVWRVRADGRVILKKRDQPDDQKV